MTRITANNGFNITELMISLVLLSVLMLGGQRVLHSYINTGTDSVRGQNLDRQAVQGIEDLRADLMSFDSTWRAKQISPIYVHNGANPTDNDSLCMVLPDRQSTTLHQFAGDVSSYDLFNNATFPVRPSVSTETSTLKANDRVLVYTTGKYAVFQVDSVNPEPQLTTISFKPAPDAEKLTNDHTGIFASFVREPAGIPAHEIAPSPSDTFSFLDTVFQKVHTVCYEARRLATDGPLYFTRTTFDEQSALALAVTSPIAQVRKLKFTMEKKGASSLEAYYAPVRGTVFDTSDVAAIQANIEVNVKSGETSFRNLNFRVALSGMVGSENNPGGDVKVVGTGPLANVDTLGKPVLELYGDGEARMMMPSVAFGSDLIGSTGALKIVKAETGEMLGTIPLVTASGVQFLPMSSIRMTGFPMNKGILVGGYTEVNGTPSPAIALIKRDAVTGKIEGEPTSGAPKNYAKVVPLPPPAIGSGPLDTNAIAMSGDRIYVASLNIDSPTANLKIFETSLRSDDTLTAPKEILSVAQPSPLTPVYISAVAAGVEIRRDNSTSTDNTEKYVAFSQSNSGPGVKDGAIFVARVNPSTGALDTPIKIADTNWPATSLQVGPQGTLLVGGKFNVTTISQPTLFRAIVQAQPYQDPINQAVMLDPVCLYKQMNMGCSYYEVLKSDGTAATNPDGSAILLTRGKGMDVFPSADNLVVMATANDIIGGRGGLTTFVHLGGVRQSIVSSLNRKGKLNQTEVKSASIMGDASLSGGAPLTYLPPGEPQYNYSTGGFYTLGGAPPSSTDTCRPAGTVSLALDCVANFMGSKLQSSTPPVGGLSLQ